MSTDLSMPCFLHQVSMKSLVSLFKVDLALSHEILLVSVYLGSLVNNFPSFFWSDPYVSSHYVSVIFVYKARACTDKWENGIVLRKTLTTRFEINLLNLNILDIIRFVSNYTTVGSSYQLDITN